MMLIEETPLNLMFQGCPLNAILSPNILSPKGGLPQNGSLPAHWHALAAISFASSGMLHLEYMVIYIYIYVFLLGGESHEEVLLWCERTCDFD